MRYLTVRKLLLISFWALSVHPAILAQSLRNSSLQSLAVLTKVSAPVYPPLARQARIQGDVRLTVSISRDGLVKSVGLVSGPPMLAPVALQSVKDSQFDCTKCLDETTFYSLVYSFELLPDKCCVADDSPSGQVSIILQRLPGTTTSENHVTVTAVPTCICDPSAELVRVRSIKCLYIWKCHRR